MGDPLEVLPSMASQADMGFKLVGGFKHFLFSTLYGMSSFPLTFIFFKMVKTTHQQRYNFISGIQSNECIVFRDPSRLPGVPDPQVSGLHRLMMAIHCGAP
jgi:hypothetical protein